MKTRQVIFAVLAVSLATSVFAADGAAPATQPSTTQPSSIDPHAARLFRAACDQLAASKAFSVKAEVWEDAVVLGHKVSTTKTVEARVRRPDGLQIEIRSARRNRGFWFDGKAFALLDRVNNLYGTLPAPGTIDALLDTIEDKFGIVFPLEDVIVSDPHASASAGIKGMANFGSVTVLGTPCQHIAFGTDNVDCQLWIQDGSLLLRKLVITYKQQETAPQLTAIFSDWNLKQEHPADTFTFTPPKGSNKIEILPSNEAK